LYVDISRIASLRRIEVLPDEIKIGATSTHSDIAAELSALPECSGLVTAASKAANPSIRNMATLGGNLNCAAFAASDLIPALLCLEAEVELLSPSGPERMSLTSFLAARERLAPGTLLTRVRFARATAKYAHVRLPLRKSGDYPVAIVSAALSLADSGAVDNLKLAVGSVEPVARRWTRLEDFARGRSLSEEDLALAARDMVEEFHARDGIEAEGWYRIQVLPALVRRAFRNLLSTA
jgi:carbon-monoxide dehydrogenase medium subunit